MSALVNKIKFDIDGASYDKYNFLNIVLTQEVLKPNELKFTMQKKDNSIELNDAKFKTPEKLIGSKIKLVITTERYNEKGEDIIENTLTFNGIIFNVNIIRSSMSSEILIDVIAYSPDYLLVDNKHCCTYLDKTLDDIVNEITAPYSFPGFSSCSLFSNIIPYSVQYNESRYEYLVRLAKRYGEWFYNDGEKLFFGMLDRQKKIELHSHTDILDYKYLTHVNNNLAGHSNYNYMANTIEDYFENLYREDYDHEFNKTINSKSLSLYLTPKEGRNIHCLIPENENDESNLKAMASGKEAQQIVCSGKTVRADLRIGSPCIISDLYDESDKSVRHERSELVVCKIIHKVGVDGFYINEFTAISAWSMYPPYHDSDIYPTSGIQQAKVIDNNDPEKMGRVKVEFLWSKLYASSRETPWIRIAQPHGGKGKGFYFIPEIDETVMIGFEVENVEKPFVIGTVYNGEARPGNGWAGSGNSYKAIRTRSHTIEIHDGQEGGEILIYDKKKDDSFHYRVTFSAAEDLIKMESKGNIMLLADKNIILEAKNNIRLNAGKEVAKDNYNSDEETDIILDAKNNIRLNASENDVGFNFAENDIFITSKSVNMEAVEDVNVNAKNKYSKIEEIERLDAKSQQTVLKERIDIRAETINVEAKNLLQLVGKKRVMINP